jgi:sugar (pentulose or hexulose) kinase
VLFDLLAAIPPELRAELASIAIDGTSATALLLDRASGHVLAPAKLYNEAQPAAAVAAAKVRLRR